MMDKLPVDNEVHDLKLGSSFNRNPSKAFHAMRYDFKPASVATDVVSNVEVGENNSVTVTVPHVEGSGTSHTVYKGNKRPAQKECVLIIDHQTGEYTLEKLQSTLQLKKTRLEGSSRIRPTTPVEQLTKPKAEVKQSPVKKSRETYSSSQASQNPPPAIPYATPVSNTNPVPSSHAPASPASTNSSSSGSESSDSEDEQPQQKGALVESKEVSRPFNISDDLRLSESGSDSD